MRQFGPRTNPNHHYLFPLGKEKRKDLNQGAVSLSDVTRPSKLDNTISLLEPSEQRAILNARHKS